MHNRRIVSLPLLAYVGGALLVSIGALLYSLGEAPNDRERSLLVIAGGCGIAGVTVMEVLGYSLGLVVWIHWRRYRLVGYAEFWAALTAAVLGIASIAFYIVAERWNFDPPLETRPVVWLPRNILLPFVLARLIVRRAHDDGPGFPIIVHAPPAEKKVITDITRKEVAG
jgi:hypothetical protein